MPLYTWSQGEQLTSVKFNSYLRDRSITPCLSSARPGSPVEGQVIYETDTGALKIYRYNVWVPLEGHSVINQQSGTSYTFALSDAGGYVEFTSSSAVTATIPSNASAAFKIGDRIDVTQAGTGAVTFAVPSPNPDGVVLRSFASLSKTRGQWATVTLLKRDTNEWQIIGLLG